MKRWVGVILGISLVVILAGLALMYLRQDPHVEFRKFLAAQAAKNEIALKGKFNDKNSEVSVEYLFNSSKRNVMVYRTAACKSNYNTNTIYLNASVYALDGKQYIRLDEAKGIVQENGAPSRDLQKVFSKAKGNWYQVPEAEAVVNSAQNYGVLVIDSGIIDSNLQNNKIADLLINTQAMQLKKAQKSDSGWTYEISNSRVGWQKSLDQIYGSQRVISEQLLSMFGKTDKKSVIITGADSSGNFGSMKTMNKNYCVDLFSAFMGIKPKDQADQILGDFKIIPAETVNQQNVSNAKPLNNLSNDLQL